MRVTHLKNKTFYLKLANQKWFFKLFLNDFTTQKVSFLIFDRITYCFYFYSIRKNCSFTIIFHQIVK